MKRNWIFHFAGAVVFLPLLAHAQVTTGPACPVAFLHFNPDAVSVRVKNVSGKTIVGLSFYAALSDATEHWTWLHWNLNQDQPLREFGWNKPIKPDQAKTLSWNRADLDFEHEAGTAFVLTSVLFQDGSRWDEPADSTSCKLVWHKGRHKAFTTAIELPPRQP
ncbi:MAG TPA: hypothetical protein VH088_11350 [Terriglobales bacterium]|nr:hypothetical protein [Terriglobales bacterium]